MSNYFEYNGKIAFHPGYYIKEIIEDSGLSQKDFANRLDTTPKNLSILLSGEQSLSIDMALKLSRMLGTSVEYWLNLQNKYDALISEFESQIELEKEKEVFKYLDYSYFKKYFNFPDLPRKIDEQIKMVREFLKVSSLTVLKKPGLSVSFRRSFEDNQEANITRANVMVQIAINMLLETDIPKYNKRKFENCIEYALTLTTEHKKFYPLLQKAFMEAGVLFIILPNLSGSKINGATKRVGQHIMLMVNDRRLFSDTFWFTLFHEIGHIINDDFGITIEYDDMEEIADKYAENKLIPSESYKMFVENGQFEEYSIKKFANSINRDPGIILGRLQHDKIVPYSNKQLSGVLRQEYKLKW